VLSRLQREWRLITVRPAVLARVARWGLVEPSPRSLDELLVATGMGDPAPAHTERAQRANALLAGLLVTARTDELAARVVLQRILPGLSSVARRHSDGFDSRIAALDELLAAAWTVIRSFPVERRPNHLASNLLRDSEYHAFRRATRRKLVHELTDPCDLDAACDRPTAMEPLDELLELVAEARRSNLTDGDLRLLSLLLSCANTTEVAAQLEVSERTVRNHRDAMVHRLRSAVAA
jgi:DNA-binding CsgD family transcriptional regulator